MLKNIVNSYYVEMPRSPPTPINNQQDELMVNLEDSNLKLDDITIPKQTQKLQNWIICYPYQDYQQGEYMANNL